MMMDEETKNILKDIGRTLNAIFWMLISIWILALFILLSIKST